MVAQEKLHCIHYYFYGAAAVFLIFSQQPVCILNTAHFLPVFFANATTSCCCILHMVYTIWRKNTADFSVSPKEIRTCIGFNVAVSIDVFF